MSILATLVTVGVGRVKQGQKAKQTEGTLNKIQGALYQQWQAVLDQCVQDRVQNKIPQPVVTFCGGDPDRSVAIWAYAHLKREFPQSFAEATSPVNIGNVWSLPPSNTFTSLMGQPSPGSQYEAPALLYIILSQKGNRGMIFQADDVTATAQANIGGFAVFKDSWGTPITFIRFLENSELSGSEFVNSKILSQDPHMKVSTQDPLDPKGKLYNAWPAPAPINRATAQNTLALGVTFNGTVKPANQSFDGTNKIISAIELVPI